LIKVKKFEFFLPEVRNFTTQKKSAMIEAKDIFEKNDPSCHISRKKQVEIQTIASCMSLGYDSIPNNLYFPLTFIQIWLNPSASSC
jgi:hypothetical protein